MNVSLLKDNLRFAAAGMVLAAALAAVLAFPEALAADQARGAATGSHARIFHKKGASRIPGFSIQTVVLRKGTDGKLTGIARGTFDTSSGPLRCKQGKLEISDGGKFALRMEFSGGWNRLEFQQESEAKAALLETVYLLPKEGAGREPASVESESPELPAGKVRASSKSLEESRKKRPHSLSIIYKPGTVQLSQTLQSTLDRVSHSTTQFTEAELRFRWFLNGASLIDVTGRFQSVIQPQLELGNYAMAASTGRIISGDVRYHLVFPLAGGGEIRPFFGFGYVPSYVYEFISNTELSLNTIGDLRLSFGASGVTLVSEGRKGWLEYSVGIGKGLGKFSTARSSWSTSEQYMGRLIYSEPLGARSRYQIGVDATIRKNTFLIERDIWIQEATEFGAILGVSYEL